MFPLLQSRALSPRTFGDSLVYGQSQLADMLDKLREMKVLAPDVKGEMESLGATARKAGDFSTITGSIQQFTDAVSGPLTDALVTMATTGEVNFGKLGKAILTGLIQMAAQQTVKYSLIAATEGILALVDPNNEWSSDKVPHATKAMGALQAAAIYGSITAGAGLAGMAHDGLSSIPDDGTWLLKKGERVVNDKDNAALSNMVNNWQNGKSVVVNMPVTINGGDEEGVKKSLPKMKQAIIEAVTADISSNGAIRKAIQSYT
jgi:hypothetical protein